MATKTKYAAKPLSLKDNGKKTNNPHDHFFQLMCKNSKVAIDLIKSAVSPKIFNQIDLKSLRPTDKSFVSQELKKNHSDMIWEARINNKDAYIAFICEHQSSADELMAFRKLEYSVGLMRDHFARGNKKAPVIIDICLYHGTDSPYPYSTSIYDIFYDPELAKECMFKDFNLIDLTVMSDEEILNQGYAGLMEFLFAHCRNRDEAFSRRVKTLVQLLRMFDPKLYLRPVLQYIGSTSGDNDDVGKLLDNLAKELPEQEKEIMTYNEQLEQRGYESAMQHIDIEKQEAASKAAKHAAHEKEVEIAKKMLLMDTSFEVISDITGLAITEVKKLKQAITH